MHVNVYNDFTARFNKTLPSSWGMYAYDMVLLYIPLHRTCTFTVVADVISFLWYPGVLMVTISCKNGKKNRIWCYFRIELTPFPYTFFTFTQVFCFACFFNPSKLTHSHSNVFLFASILYCCALNFTVFYFVYFRFADVVFKLSFFMCIFVIFLHV